jgi:hypothetical protein
VYSAVVEAYSWPAWVLDEQRVPAVFDQVRDVGEVQRVEVQPGAQPERVAGGGEPFVQGADPAYPGQAGIKGRASLIQCSSTPGSHGHTFSALRLRRRPIGGLAEPDPAQGRTRRCISR